MNDDKPTRTPPPDQIMNPDPDPTGVEFMSAELPTHVREFFDEQRKLHELT